jgi:hypothetical protein
MVGTSVLCILCMHARSHAATQIAELAESIARQLKTVEVVDREVTDTAAAWNLVEDNFWTINVGANVANPDQMYGVIKVATLVRDMITGIDLDLESIQVGADPVLLG